MALAPLRLLRRYVTDRRGAVTPIMVLALVPLIGALGMGIEVSNWWMSQRAAQNAADSAAMSASWNGGTTAACSGSCNTTSYSTAGCATHPDYFDCEAIGAASQAGFVNGANNVVVDPQYLTSGCPGTVKTCYEVTVTTRLPLYLLGVVMGGGRSTQTVQAVAYAGLESQPLAADCLFSLDSTSGDTGLTSNGAPKANLAGCDIQVNSSASCHGHDLGADAVFAVGTDSGCGNTKVSGAGSVSDPYASLASNIPPDPGCTSLPSGDTNPDPYPQESEGTLPNLNNSVKGSTPTVWWGAKLSGAYTWGSTEYFCGDVLATGPVTIKSDTTVVIYNGQLDMGGSSFTFSGNGGTVIFTGSNSYSYQGTGKKGKPTTITVTPSHVWGTSGTIDIDAPTSGTWSGIAVYQDPKLTSGVSISAAGNSPTMNFTGVIYQPNAVDTFSGAINKSTNGLSCFVWVFYQMTINGTASIFQGTQSQCSQAGVTQVHSDQSVHMLVSDGTRGG